MKTTKVEFRIDVPENVTMEHLEEFLAFNLDIRASLKDGPLSDGDMDQLNPSGLIVRYW